MKDFKTTSKKQTISEIGKFPKKTIFMVQVRYENSVSLRMVDRKETLRIIDLVYKVRFTQDADWTSGDPIATIELTQKAMNCKSLSLVIF